MTHKQILQSLKQKYPQLKLSFGYIGNCGINYDDRLWMFFTRVPKPTHSDCFHYTLGSTNNYQQTLDKPDFLDNFTKWIESHVLPHVQHQYKYFHVLVNTDYDKLVEQHLINLGASFGLRGYGKFWFSIQHQSLQSLTDILKPLGLIEITEENY